jgi:hypothetical protein
MKPRNPSGAVLRQEGIMTVELSFDVDTELDFTRVDLSLRVLEKKVESTLENRMREISDHDEFRSDRIVYETIYAIHTKWVEKIGDPKLGRPYIRDWC